MCKKVGEEPLMKPGIPHDKKKAGETPARKYGADDGNRTRGLIITSDALCQLSYFGTRQQSSYKLARLS